MKCRGRGFHAISVGGPSPYSMPAEGARLDIGPGGLNLVVSITNPSKVEIRALRRGQMDVRMVMSGSTAILLWRFMGKSGRPAVELESVFHMGLLPIDSRRVPSGAAGLVHGVTIILQDERSTCRALRLVSLPAETSDEIDAVVAMQARQASEHGWNRKVHDAEVEFYLRDFPTVRHAFA